MSMVCVHCKTKKVNRPRGLCWGCYYSPEVQAKFPPSVKFASLGHGVSGKKPCVPTDALPGTEAKIAVLAGRAERNERMHHEDDAKG